MIDIINVLRREYSKAWIVPDNDDSCVVFRDTPHGCQNR
jgi:hypothetical protein